MGCNPTTFRERDSYMPNLKTLSVTELEKLTADAKAELTARKEKNKQIALVREQVDRKLAKAGLSISDLYPSLGKGKKATGAARKTKKPARKKSIVKPKYKDASGRNKWTGRGRSPIWVREICEREGIDVMKFKSLDKYRI